MRHFFQGMGWGCICGQVIALVTGFPTIVFYLMFAAIFFLALSLVPSLFAPNCPKCGEKHWTFMYGKSPKCGC